jgi:hypothetical protein
MGAAPIYVPVLKGKEGEFAALEALSPDIRRQVLPLIEVPPIPYDYVNERAAKSLEDHVAGVAQRLQRCWQNSPLYLDLPWFEEDERLSDGRVALEAVLHDCVDRNVEAVPVVSRSSSINYISAASRYANSRPSPVCIRLLVEDFEEEVDLDQEVERILKVLRVVEPPSIDLVIDLEDLGSEASRAVLVARSIFSVIPRKNDWRRIILVAASFPEDLSDLDASMVSQLPRHEWELWKTLQRRPTRLPRPNVIFGDYAISHPLPRELDPRTMRMSASIRYTTRDEWLVAKGRNVRQYGFDQYFALSKALVERPEFSGRTFSWGDSFIADCADQLMGPGNATTWRKVGTNHHITLVTRELANLVPAV